MRVKYVFLYAFAYSQQLSFYNNKKQYKNYTIITAGGSLKLLTYLI